MRPKWVLISWFRESLGHSCRISIALRARTSRRGTPGLVARTRTRTRTRYLINKHGAKKSETRIHGGRRSARAAATKKARAKGKKRGLVGGHISI